MHVRCPHCHQSIELVQDDLALDVLCPSCGDSFNLISGDTETGELLEPHRIGQFELLERVGMGKFGSVWRARDTQLDRIVAVKIPRKDQLDAAEVEMFFREARTAAQLRHPNIVGVHEIGRDEDSIYIVSDFVQGVNLHEWLTAKRLTPREAAELCTKIADAVAHAHAAGIVHRDLKPGNIMLGADGQPYITDFGLAKRESGEITMTVDGAILGTPAYMSPEQARGEGHRADAQRRLFAGRGAVRAAHRRTSVPRRNANAVDADSPRRTPQSAQTQCPSAARSRDDLLEVPGEGAGAAVSNGAATDGRSAAVSRRSTDRRPSDFAACADCGDGVSGIRRSPASARPSYLRC